MHITASYWKTWPTTKEKLALAKQALAMSLSRHITCGLWSLEYQTERFKKHGVWVPHFHILGWLGGRDVLEFEDWLRTWWAGFSGNDSEHGIAVTSGDQARGVWYLAMHSGKRAQSPPFKVGRWWGYVNRPVFMLARDLHATGEIDLREHIWWARLYRRATHAKVRQRGQLLLGFSWFLPRADQCQAHAWIVGHIASERRVRFQGKAPF